MKLKFFNLIIGLALLSTLCYGEESSKTAVKQTSSMRVCSSNIRCASFKDGEDSWAKRRPGCLEVLKRQNADIYCFQEMQRPQRKAIEKAFPDYRLFAALSYPNPAKGGHPLNAILYRKSRFREIGAGAYALSNRPHMLGTCDWGNGPARFVNYLILQDIPSGKIFRVVNTHLDHKSQPSREKSADLINEESAAYPAELPQILTGDMNSAIDNPAMKKLLKAGWLDTYREATGVVDPGFTYHAFRGLEFKKWNKKIDFIFTRGKLKTIDAQVIKDKGSNGRYPSDHFFVRADLEL